MGFTALVPSLTISPPPAPPTENNSSENDDGLLPSNSIDSALTESTYASTCPPSPSTTHSSIVALSPTTVHSNEPSITYSSSNTTNTTGIPSPNRRRLHREWKQKSIVRRASSIIQSEVTNMIANSTFLNRPDVESKQNAIPLFHRSEIKIGALIGTGGFSHVCQITEFILDPTISDQCTIEQQILREELSQQVQNGTKKLVLKHLKRALALSSATAMSRAACDLIMEATYMSSMDHPNVLPIRALPIENVHSYDTGDYDGYFIIMDELCKTLGDEIQDWKRNVSSAPSITEKMGYALQIASALEYLHTSCHMIFRDLKPHNIGVTSIGTIQLFDFGLCRELPSDVVLNDENKLDVSTSSNIDDDADADGDEVYVMSGVGTRRYMAPEIINDGRYNTKVDVYGWSMVVSELITGIKPYTNYDVEEHRVAVCQGGERPYIHCFWPHYVQTVLFNTWCESVTDRWSIRQVTLYVSKMILDDDDNTGHVACTSSPERSSDFAKSNVFGPSSPVDVKHMTEFGIVSKATTDWWLQQIPELPDLYSSSVDNDNSTTVTTTTTATAIFDKPQRRHSLDPRLQPQISLVDHELHFIDDSSILFSREEGSSDFISKEQQQPLTMCQCNGTVEVVCRLYLPTNVQLRPRPSLMQPPYRGNSCIIMLQ